MQNWIYVLKGIRLKHLIINIRKSIALLWTLKTMDCIISYNIFYLNSSIFQVILDNYDSEKKLFSFISESNYYLLFVNQIINRSVYYYLAVSLD